MTHLIKNRIAQFFYVFNLNQKEKATSPLLLEVDWDCILRMCDLIRQGDVQ
jgi:hypothetical protein